MKVSWDPHFEELLRSHLRLIDDGDTLRPDSDLRELGLESMSIVQLVFQIEDDYRVTIPGEELNAATFATPGALWQVVTRLRADHTVDGGGTR